LAGRNGFAGGTAYAASKHGVLGFSRPLMLEVRKEGLRVVTICPGSVDTGMLRGQPMLKSEPARILRPEDVADALLHPVQLPERARVYFAFQASWLGVVLPLVTTLLTWAAVKRGERLGRLRSAELRRALEASAARNRELERLRHLAATLLAGTDIARLVDEVARAA